VFFKVETILVEGQTMYKNEDIAAASGIKIGDNQLRIRTKAGEAAIVRTYPYAAQAKITRSLPHTLVITVTQAEAAEAVETPSGTLLLDKNGRVLETNLPKAPEGFLRVSGFSATEGLVPGDYLPEEEMARFEILRELTDGIREQELEDISLIDVRDRLDLMLLYDGRVAVLLGSPMDIEYKLRFARKTIGEAVSANTAGMLDVTTRPVARLRETDIYAEENWPFAPELRADYERKIAKAAPPAVVPDDETVRDTGETGGAG
jgi:hypothetical protein